MDTRDIFRRFFGFPNRHPSSLGDLDEEAGNNGRDERFDIYFDDSNRGLEGMFEHFHGDMWRQMESLHRQMEDLFKGFGAVDFHSSFDQPDLRLLDPDGQGKPNLRLLDPDGQGKPDLRLLDPDGQGKPGRDDKMVIWSSIPNPFFRRGDKRSPRDLMLKEGSDTDFHPRKPALSAPPAVDHRSKLDSVYAVPGRNTTDSQNKRDTDLDGKISEDKILEMIKKPQKDQPSMGKPLVELMPNHFSSRRSVSVMTVKGADNRVEHKRTVKDSSGNEESTVTRSMGGKSYSVTTVTSKDGSQQKHETFTNMDQSDVSRFEEDWVKRRQNPTATKSADTMLSQWHVPAIDEKDRNLYSKLFGWKNR